MLFAWQGWKIEIPHRWSPLRLEGDYDEGYALIADLQHPRLGIRWKQAGRRKLDADTWAKLAIAKEAGVLAANESQPLPTHHVAGDFAGNWEGGRLYTEPQPPGRDIWVAFSPASGRTVQLIYHAQRRDSAFARRLLPTFADQSPTAPAQWAAFDLQCTVPAGWRLSRHRLNVGDLALTFTAGRQHQCTVRQIALASLALQRLPLQQWLTDQLKWRRKHYRPLGSPAAGAAEGFEGLQQASRRRRRFFFNPSLAPTFLTLAVEDKTRDRIVIVDATDPLQARELLATVTSPLLHAPAREAS